MPTKAEEMFEQWWDRRAESTGEITGAWYHDIKVSFLAAHAAQQKVIDEQAVSLEVLSGWVLTFPKSSVQKEVWDEAYKYIEE